MSSAGQAIGGGIGAIAGFLIGGPTGLKYGAQIGMTLGGLLDPPKGPNTQGPRLSDLSIQTSTYGAVIPRCYGTTAIYGNVFWLENNKIFEFARKKKSGGKGGGSKSTATTYSYFATFALGLCEGPIVSVRRIWIGSKIVYDGGATDQGAIRTSNQFYGTFKLYKGTDTQTADPRMQATLGAANVPGYRGIAYLVFYDLPLADFQNSLMGAPIKVEVVASGSVADYVATPHFMPAQIPWTSMDWNGRYYAAVADHALATDLATSPDGITWTAQTLPADATGSFTSIACIPQRWIAHKGTRVKYWISPDCVNWQEIAGGINSVNEAWIFYSDGTRFLAIGRLSHTTAFVSGDGIGWTETQTLPAYSSMQNNGAASNGKIWVAINQGYGSAMVLEGLIWTAYALPAGSGNIYGIVYSDDLGLFLAVGPNRYATSSDGKTWTGGTCAAGNAGEFYSYASGRWWSGQFYSLDGSTWVSYPLPNNIGGTNIYAAKWNGAVHCILGANGAYESCWTVAIATLTQAYPTLANVVQAELLKSALLTAGDINVTALAATTVRGYTVATVAALRSALEPLQAAWPFDAIQAGYKIKFVKRGGVSIATVSAAELDARAAGDSPGVSITNVREMDIVLPRKVRLLHIDYDREYDSGEQYAERLNTDAVNIRSVELAIVLTADEAAGMAEVLLYLAWLERYDIALSLPSTYNHLEPADVITVNATEGQYSLRLTSVTNTQDGRVECQAKYNSAATYTATAVGVPGAVTGNTLSETGQTAYAVLDIPTIIDTTDTPGVVIAMAGYSAGWSGATLFRSDDAGQIWSDMQGISAPGSNMGLTQTALATGRADIIDTANTLTVAMIEGALSSVSELSMLNGANWFAIGDHGRWEIVAAKTCTLVAGSTYTLSDFLRGRFGTEWAMSLHSVGDWVVQLDGASAAFVNYALSAIGVSHYYRGITNGQSFDSDIDRVQAYTGVALECLSPVYFNGSRNSATGDWSISWVRRTRIGGEWKDNIDAPLSEASESYTLDIFSDGLYSAIKRTVTVTSANFTYTSAMQVADFGANQYFIVVNIYQNSANVGRGYPLKRWLPRTENPPFPSALLMHCNDAGLTDFYGHTVSLGGGAARSALQSVFGGYSASVPATGYMTITGLPVTGASLMCAEAFVRFTNITAALTLFTCGSVAGFNGWKTSIVSSKLYHTSFSGAAGSTTLVNNRWYHIAVLYIAPNFYVMLDGVLEITLAMPAQNSTSTTLQVGDPVSGDPIYVDELRYTVGDARYPSLSFTPPAAEFLE